MISVNALELRNKLGAFLDSVVKTGEPVIITRGKKPTAAIITIEAFKRRFLDLEAESERKELIEKIAALRENSAVDSLAELRKLRGYLS